MDHHNILASSQHSSSQASSIIFKEMSKKEMQKLIIDLINKKNRGESLEHYPVTDVEFYACSPDELVANVNGEGPWYFVTLRKPISEGSATACRKAGDGNWKQNAGLINIYDEKELIGHERYFKYYYQNGVETDWCFHEYEENNTLPKPDKLKYNYVLCEMYKLPPGKPGRNNGKRKGSSSQQEEESPAKRAAINNPPAAVASSSTVPRVEDTHADVQEDGSEWIYNMPLDGINDVIAYFGDEV